MDMTAVSGAFTALRGATDITKAMIGLRDSNKLDGKVWELQQAIIGAQTLVMEARETQVELVSEVARLQIKVAELQAWEEEAANYKLRSLSPGVLVRTFESVDESSTPQHDLCVTCFDRKQKSNLQRMVLAHARNSVLICNTCRSVIYATGQAMPEHAAILNAIRQGNQPSAAD